MKSELDAIKAATEATKAAVDLAASLTQTTSYEENTDWKQAVDDQYLAAGATYTLLNVTGKGVLRGLMVAGSGEHTQAFIYVDGTQMKNVYMDNLGGRVRLYFDIEHIHDWMGSKSDYLEVNNWDTDNDSYSMMLTRYIFFNSSLKIVLKNNNSDSQDVAGNATYRLR